MAHNPLLFCDFFVQYKKMESREWRKNNLTSEEMDQIEGTAHAKESVEQPHRIRAAYHARALDAAHGIRA